MGWSLILKSVLQHSSSQKTSSRRNGTTLAQAMRMCPVLRSMRHSYPESWDNWQNLLQGLLEDVWPCRPSWQTSFRKSPRQRGDLQGVNLKTGNGSTFVSGAMLNGKAHSGDFGTEEARNLSVENVTVRSGLFLCVSQWVCTCG
jgi:hypothetical protein